MSRESAVSENVITVGVQDLITRIDVYPVHRGQTLALARIHIADFFIVNAFLRQGQYGPYLSLPRHKDQQTDLWVDDVAFTAPEVRQTVTELVLATYRRLMGPSAE